MLKGIRPSPPPEKLVPPLRREDKASITLEMSQPLDLHAGQERLVDTNSAVVEEPCAPIQTAAQAVFDLEQPAIQPAVADAVDFEEQPRGRIRPIAIDEEPAPFFDILSSSASRQKPIDLAQFNSRQRQVTDSGPRRRLPRSLVGESLDFSCESGANYDFRPRQQAAPKGVPLSLSITEQHGGSRFWQYIGIGVVFQIIVLCLMAAFCRGS